MNLIKFSPRTLTPWFDDFDRFFASGSLPSWRGPHTGSWSPGVDIVENEKNVLLRVDLPGVDQENIDIQMEDGVMTLKAERKFDKETQDGNYQRVERGYGLFERSFSLPENVDGDNISAAYNMGVLDVTLPKVKVKSKKVKVVAVK